ncbi:MAG: A/G-specific adenine glycosylase [Chloroflexi bacterium]|nr:A/G-specific adenine glycosylase [Chloroflexota bacterium]
MPSEAVSPGFQAALLRWYRQHGRDLPWRRTRDPYAILVAEVMLQQTQVERVIPKYHEFLARFPTVTALAAAPLAEVIRAWSPLGYNLRALRLHELARGVCARWNGALPSDPSTLRCLPGIGPYTANALACFAFDVQVPVLDTNIRRVLGRLFHGIEPTRGHELRDTAQAALPEGEASHWNQALMDLGATLCTPQRPRCLLCPVRAWCKGAPLLTSGARKVAEQRGAYPARALAPFRGSARYYRGRIVEHLRRLGDGQRMPAIALGQALKGDFTPEDGPWLLDLLHGLGRDRLVALHWPPAAEENRSIAELGVSLP